MSSTRFRPSGSRPDGLIELIVTGSKRRDFSPSARPPAVHIDVPTTARVIAGLGPRALASTAHLGATFSPAVQTPRSNSSPLPSRTKKRFRSQRPVVGPFRRGATLEVGPDDLAHGAPQPVTKMSTSPQRSATSGPRVTSRLAGRHPGPDTATTQRPRTEPRGAGVAGLAIITEACIDVKDRACVDVCPVQCIYEYDPAENLLFSEAEAGSGVIENAHTPSPDAIAVFADTILYVNLEECTSCTACYQPDICPVGAIYSEDHLPDGSPTEREVQRQGREQGTRSHLLPRPQPRCLRGLAPSRRCPRSRSSWGCCSTHVAVRRSSCGT